MALKDITLGQYFPGNTILHRLDPRAKILLVVFYIVALFLAKNAFGYLLLAAFLTAAVLISKVGFKAVIRGMRPIVFIVIFTGVLNLLYTTGAGEPLVSIGFVRIYREGIRTAIFMVLRIMLLISCTFMLTYTTSPIRLTDGLESLLGPLKKLHVPIHELAMMMSIALRFIPTLIEETDKIMSAQRARGADFDSGGLIDRAKALIPLLVPLFISAFRRADELAVAMECRCYHGGEGRTKLMQLKYALPDYGAIVLGAGLCAAVLLLNRFGTL
ncbi:MAG: energy-coupling factor transporter transmembrane component T [Clostridiales bacterium]|nr:energy-coupling factor transporter transmembrane component T [Clostridiales bacterium]